MIKLKHDDEFSNIEFFGYFTKSGCIVTQEPINPLELEYKELFCSLSDSLELSTEKKDRLEAKILAAKSSSEDIMIDLDKILSVYDRLVMIKELMENESNIKFGIFGLVFYLGLTCFDSIGQVRKYMNFYEWLIWRKNQEIPKLNESISRSHKIDIKSEITQLYEKYIRDYGMKNSFFSTLDMIASEGCYKNLLANIKLDKDLQKELDEEGLNDEFKRNWLYNFRNKFTHSALNRRLPVNEDNFPCHLIDEINRQKFKIEISPKEIMSSLQDCIEAALIFKIDKITSAGADL